MVNAKGGGVSGLVESAVPPSSNKLAWLEEQIGWRSQPPASQWAPPQNALPPSLAARHALEDSVDWDAEVARRKFLLFFQGSLEWFDGDKSYSRGVRPAIKKLPKDPLLRIGEGKSATYVEDMLDSLFCLCPLGE